jgi:hypothetical protein
MTVKHEGDTHWYLVNVNTTQKLDPTATQFKTRPPYIKGRGCGFLTKKPSKRAREMMEKMLWQG